MKKLLGYLPFHFLLYLIVGIIIQYTTNVWAYGKMWLFIVLLINMVLLIVIKRVKTFIILTWITFFLLGISTVYLNDVRNSNEYYEKHLFNSNNVHSILIINEVLKSGRFYNKYEAEVIQVGNKKTKGRVLLNIQIDTINAIRLKVDDQIYMASQFFKISPPLNPYQFNYKSYLTKKEIHQQLFLNHNQFLKGKKSTYFLGFIAKIRSKIQKSLQEQNFSKDTYAVMNALLLGQRKDMSRELRDDYVKAGAIHILAVSGLHVGIILLVLSFLLKPLKRIKNGRILKLILTVLFLWLFALIAGMSASVVRAVTMFSAVAIGEVTRNKHSIEHSLIFSMFILLFCRPMFLFDVGFQLSYIAVFGIVWIQPKLSNLWKPNSRFIYKLWQLFTVSLAAQLAVLPLSLFYFHQFPALFWLSNLVIVPFLGIILIGGFFIMILSIFSLLPEFFIRFYDGIISLMNDFIAFISKQEVFVFSEVSFSALIMSVSYLLIVFGVYFFYKVSMKRLLLLLAAVVIFQIVLTFEKFQTHHKKELIIFHKSRSSLYGIREGIQLKIYHSLDATDIINEHILTTYKVGENVQIEYGSMQPNYLSYFNRHILIVDSLGIYNVEGIQSPIVLLKESPKIHLGRLIDKLKPTQIVADGSNYKSLIALWKQTCLKMKTPFWDTSQNGAYILE